MSLNQEEIELEWQDEEFSELQFKEIQSDNRTF